jgi:hypothetical protein
VAACARPGLNPFVSKEVWAPVGVNLAWAQTAPALAVALAPVTYLAEPPVAYNVAALLMPALAAWTAFLLCRRLTRGALWPSPLGHWYPRLRIAVGRFDYDRRGIPDATHMRFFTWRSFAAMAARVGWQVDRRRLTGLPLEVLGFDASARRTATRSLARIDRAGRTVWPSLFAYQYVAVLRRDPAFGSLDELPAAQAPRDSRRLRTPPGSAPMSSARDDVGGSDADTEDA